MNIVLLGATGFIGSSIFHSLVSSHSVMMASRRAPDGYAHWKFVDFSTENDWNDLLNEIDLVINAIGIISGDFDRIQTQSPLALYEVCIQKNIKIIHISAVGAEADDPITLFLKTKKKTDDFLLAYQHAKVVYPGIVLGERGKSTQFFAEIAQFPIVPILSNHPVPTVHITQLTGLITQLVDDFTNYPNQIFVSAPPEPMQDIFTALRGKKPLFVKIPSSFSKLLFGIFPKMSIGIFNKDMLRMLDSISATKYTPAFKIPATHYIKSSQIRASNYFTPLLALLAISFIWIWSGVSSLVSWSQSYLLMKEIGANHLVSVLAVYAGSIADIVLGIAVFSKKYRKPILLFQLLFIATYTGILTWFAPVYWWHPFGVLAKNIPLIALTYYLYTVQDEK